MAYQIIWTAEAEDDFYSILHYLQQHWSNYSAEKFSVRIMKKLEQLALAPYRPRFTSQANIQMIKPDKKNVLFFYG
jgi:plasmid stabilization system protein ParE